jgi:hypothetical protein
MAGLKQATTEIGADGLSVKVTTESEATAREIAAQLEGEVRAREGGFGARLNNKLANSLDRVDETLAIYGGRRTFTILRDVLTVCAMTLAGFAWYRILPGYEVLMCVIGMAIVFGMKTCAGRLYVAEQSGDKGLKNLFTALIVLGLLLEVVASSSLQAFSAVEQETGRADITAQISVLEDEQRRLNIALTKPPPGTAAQQQALVDAYRATPMVNADGVQLVKTVGVMADETECKGRSYYVGIYCPPYLELVAKVDAAKAYESDKERMSQIPGELAVLRAKRPPSSSTFALAAKGGDTAWLLSLLIPVGLALLLNLAMLVVAYVVGRPEQVAPLAEEPVT